MEFLKILSGIFIPFIEGVRIIGFLLGIISLSYSNVSIHNPRFYEESDEVVFSFYLDNALNEKFKKLIYSEMPSYLVFDIGFSSKSFNTNYVFTNSVIYSSYNGEFKVSFYNMGKKFYIVSRNFDEVRSKMCNIFVRLPRDVRGENIRVRVLVKPLCEYEGFENYDVSRVVWGGVFSVEMSYRL